MATQPPTQQKMRPDRSIRVGFSDYIMGGRVPFPEVVGEIYDAINKEYGTNIEPPR